MTLPTNTTNLLGDDVCNIIMSYKKDLEIFEAHKQKMGKVFFKLLNPCYECDNYITKHVHSLYFAFCNKCDIPLCKKCANFIDTSTYCDCCYQYNVLGELFLD